VAHELGGVLGLIQQLPQHAKGYQVGLVGTEPLGL
jgi:hypothetical protein